MFQTKVVQKIKTRFMLNKFSPWDRTVYDGIWKKNEYSPTGHRWRCNTKHTYCMLRN